MAAAVAVSILLPGMAAASSWNEGSSQLPAGLTILADEGIREAARGETVTVEGLVFNARNETDYVRIYRDVGAGRRAAGIEVGVVAQGTVVGPGSSLPFKIVAEIAETAAPGALTEVALVAQSDLDPRVRALAWVTVVVEPSLHIQIDPDPLVQMADPGEEVEFDVSVEVSALSEFRVPVTLEAVSHQAFVALVESEWSIGTGFARSTQLRVRLPTHVVVGTELAVTLRASAAGFSATASVQVVVVVNTTHRLALDVAPFPPAAPGDVLLGRLSVRNEGTEMATIGAPRMGSEPGGWAIGSFSPPAAPQFLDAGSVAPYAFAVTVGEDAPPGTHPLSICLCPLWGHGPTVPFSVPVRRVFDLSMAPIRDTAAAGAGSVAYFDIELALEGNAPGEVRMELAGIPGTAPPRFRLLEALDGLPPGTPWPFPRAMAPGDAFRLRVDVPLGAGVEAGDRLLELTARGPRYEAASLLLRLVVGGADLAAAALVVSGPVPRAGTTVEVAVRVANVGIGAADAFVVELWDNGESVASATVPRLEAGDDTVVVLFWDVAAGEHNLTARADSPVPQGPEWGQVPEANEGDNSVSQRVSVPPDGAGALFGMLVSAGLAVVALAGVGIYTRHRRGHRAAAPPETPWIIR